MPNTLRVLAAAALLAVIAPTSSASASPSCLRGHQPFELKGDTVNWSITMPRTMECIQGLRWSYMQIYLVKVKTAPRHGTLVIVGSGFRYYANKPSEANGDRFELEVIGKNRHDHGVSFIDVTVGPTARLDKVAGAMPLPAENEYRLAGPPEP